MFSWIKKFISKKVIKKLVGSISRTALAAIAGFLAAKGFPPEVVDTLTDAAPQVEGFAAELAVALYVIIQSWSFTEKVEKTKE